jgi:hypothetical protein
MRQWVNNKRHGNGFCHNHRIQEKTKNHNGRLAWPDNDRNTATVGTMGSCSEVQMNSTKTNSSIELRVEQYYLKHGGFRHQYEPLEYWCFRCLAAREGWDEDLRCIRAPSEVLEVHSDIDARPMTDETACGAYSDDETMTGAGQDSGSAEVDCRERGRKRKIADIS